MESIQMFLGGLVLGPLFAAQAGVAWYIVVGIIRFFGHWISIILPPLRWGIWPLLRIGYVLLLAVLLFGYLNGSSGARDRPQMLAALLGVAASFAVALFLRHRGWRWLGGREQVGLATPVHHPRPDGAYDPYADPFGTRSAGSTGPRTWESPPPEPSPGRPFPAPPSWGPPPEQPSWGPPSDGPSWGPPPEQPSWGPPPDRPSWGPPPAR